uniref:Ubiquitin-like domain-containing protein n=1 Tax=Chromera velia CCMP2878 TaxID=1169474 RepID=A0A0G4FWV7_9ALVE|mmetsp:Transcript_44311/g.87470  ORF Transcript_44311/g.87470 Transcript_44311/m.87470 type:complete len:538 (-) Transcript_44311:180-1793(-)|eukprot:Cvel_3815.t1-p1 / transcript=Cvel_3815.t1 / gene=Cvel_3815 / organism=Chromera_velia_CCMP2878 / gene_product=hypothetical protein / transcript_product=hypothetical protein / location=Cvel_scaffold161:3163-4773(-) / protein_length=537 / sequence_SO=supercontig / SO=protein_coding / is_pseudo=false
MRLRVRILVGRTGFIDMEATDRVGRLRQEINAANHTQGLFADPGAIFFFSQPGRGTKHLKDESRTLGSYGVNTEGTIDLSLSFKADGGRAEFSDPLCSLVRTYAINRSEDEVPLQEIKRALLTYKEVGLEIFLTDRTQLCGSAVPQKRMTSALHGAVENFLFATQKEEAVLRKYLEVLREVLFSGLCWRILDQKDSLGRTPTEIARNALLQKSLPRLGWLYERGEKEAQSAQTESESDPARLVRRGRVMARPKSKKPQRKADPETSRDSCDCQAPWQLLQYSSWRFLESRPDPLCPVHRKPYGDFAERAGDRLRERARQPRQPREPLPLGSIFLTRGQPSAATASSSSSAAAAARPSIYTPPPQWVDMHERADSSVDQSDSEEEDDADTVSLPDSNTPAPSVSVVRQMLQEALKLLLFALRARDTVCVLRRVALLVRAQRAVAVSKPELSNSPVGLFLNLDLAVRLPAGASIHAKERSEPVDSLTDSHSSTVACSSLSSLSSIDCQSGREVGERQKRVGQLDRKLVPLQQRVLSFLW